MCLVKEGEEVEGGLNEEAGGVQITQGLMGSGWEWEFYSKSSGI